MNKSDLVAIIEGFLDDPELNRLGTGFDERAWDKPLVGFSRGDDALYLDFRKTVDPEHWIPAEAFALAFPGTAVEGRELTVISWVLPQTRATKKDNRNEAFYPSERWARSRVTGEAINEMLRQFLVNSLAEQGIQALAPTLLPQWQTVPSERFGIASSWSERHAAYASGLGTFGLSEGLITKRGKAHRVGSVIARINLSATKRPYTSSHEYCLFYASGESCRACIDRCPVGAISNKGHDKMKCLYHTATVCRDHIQTRYGLSGGYGCGLCQTGVPCESRIPRRSSQQKDEEVHSGDLLTAKQEKEKVSDQ